MFRSLLGLVLLLTVAGAAYFISDRDMGTIRTNEGALIEAQRLSDEDREALLASQGSQNAAPRVDETPVETKQAPAPEEAPPPEPAASSARQQKTAVEAPITAKLETGFAARVEQQLQKRAETGEKEPLVRRGMLLSQARTALLEGGWQPKPANDAGEARASSDTQAAHRKAGRTEVSECTDAARPVCRFEYTHAEEGELALLAAGESLKETRIVDILN